MRARNRGDLLDRWQRLEAFSHARHTVRTARCGDMSFRLEHRSRDGGPAPSTAESLLVLGAIAVLVEMTASGDVMLAAETGEVWRSGGAWHERAGAGLSGNVLLTVSRSDTPPPRQDDRPAFDPIAHVRQKLAADPIRRWSLADLACETGMSARTLQRRLAQRSLSFSRIVADTRLQVAATYLCDARGPGLAEIGFLAGYADQAHFARSFSRSVGITPSVYRSDFQA
jgi:AraC-like DNA-binding protein